MAFTKYPIIVLAFMLVLQTACEKKLEFEGEVLTSKLVVNDDFDPTRSWSVHVSNSLSVIDNASLRAIEDAEVNIFNGNELVESLTHTNDGFYHSFDMLPLPNVNYTIAVSAPGFEPVSSSSFAPENNLEISNIDTSYFEQEFSDSRSLRLDITIKDTQVGQNYYGIGATSVFINPETLQETHNQLYLNSSDLIFDASSGDNKYGESLPFDDVLFNNSQYILSVNIDEIDGQYQEIYDEFGNYIGFELVPPSVLILKIFSYSEELYLFNKSINSYENNDGDPFSQPTQIFSNIEGGFGIFGGFTEDEYIYNL